MLSPEYVKGAINYMTKNGVIFTHGLSEEELLLIEDAVGGKLPSDLRIFLSAAVPLSYNDDSRAFPAWHDNIARTAEKSRAFIEDLFKFDVVENKYWEPSFGVRPDDDSNAWKLASHNLQKLSPLVPIYRHRFMATNVGASPVFSYHGPSDTIVYATSFADYLYKEFGVPNTTNELHQDYEPGFWDKTSQ